MSKKKIDHRGDVAGSGNHDKARKENAKGKQTDKPSAESAGPIVEYQRLEEPPATREARKDVGGDVEEELSAQTVRREENEAQQFQNRSASIPDIETPSGYDAPGQSGA